MAAERAGLVARKELRIFRQFAAVCPLRIANDSIVKREPDEPDILCRIPAEWVAFEMVEIVDRERVARPRGDQDALMDVMHEAARKLPQRLRMLSRTHGSGWSLETIGVSAGADRWLSES
jgi:hypothetical protein